MTFSAIKCSLRRAKLDSLYKTFDGLNAATKDSLKSEMIESIVLSLDTVSFYNKKRYASLFEKRKPNNAYFMNFVRYDSQKEEMRKELNSKFKGNIILVFKINQSGIVIIYLRFFCVFCAILREKKLQ
jgi:hypothetical protein